MLKKLMSILLVGCFLFVVGCAAKNDNPAPHPDPNFKASLDFTEKMSDDEDDRSFKTFELKGDDMIIIGVDKIVTREPLAPVKPPTLPKTGMDVTDSFIKELGKAVPVFGRVYLGSKALDTAEELAKDNVHIVEQPAPIVVEQPPPIIVTPEPPVIVEPPVVIIDPPPPIIIEPPPPIIIEPPAPPDSIDINLGGSIDINDVTP